MTSFFFFQVVDELSKRFQQAKALLHGDPDAEPNQDLILGYLNEMFSSSLVSRLLTDLPVLEFEVGKYHKLRISIEIQNLINYFFF